MWQNIVRVSMDKHKLLQYGMWSVCVSHKYQQQGSGYAAIWIKKTFLNDNLKKLKLTGRSLHIFQFSRLITIVSVNAIVSAMFGKRRLVSGAGFCRGFNNFYRGPSFHSLLLLLFISARLAVNTPQELLLSLPVFTWPCPSILAGFLWKFLNIHMYQMVLFI